MTAGPPTNLAAGVARADITPPVPIDCVGFVRRADPATSVHSPLTATALVVDDQDRGARVAIVAFDLMGIGVEQGRRVRAEIGAAIGCPADHVLLNYSHTHAAPHPFEGDHPKLGGDLRTITTSERDYVRFVERQLVDICRQAAAELRPVRVGAGSGNCPGISVNRRERTADGRTILGWNREGVLDTEVSVVRFDDESSRPFVVLVGFPCHPVVLGGEHPFVGADFPGAVREIVEAASDATCLFLTGAAGNVLPLEGFFDEAGPERAFGFRVATEALAALATIETADSTIEPIAYGSVTPITLYRHTATDTQPSQPVDARSELVEFPLKPLPTADEVAVMLVEARASWQAAVDAGADRTVLNPLDYHVVWAERALAALHAGAAATSVDGTLQVLRIGDVAICAIPGEPFNEIGLRLKAAALAPFTFVCGYSNEYVAYFPTAAEYDYGGYEPGYSHHNSTRLEQVDASCEERIVTTLSALMRDLFPAGA